MRKIFAILFLILLLYNTFGYQLLFAYKRAQIRYLSLEHLPESAYSVLKLNLAIYTSIEDTDLKYINQEWNIENKIYRVIKNKIERDTLYVYYLPDYHQTKLRQQLNHIIENQIWNENAADTTPLKVLFKCLLKEYMFPKPIASIISSSNRYFVKKGVIPSLKQVIMPTDYLSYIDAPPEWSLVQLFR